MDLRMPRSVLEDARKEEMQNKREQDAYLKVSGNILKNIQDRMFANEYYDPDKEPEKYENYWKAKKEYDSFVDSDYGKNNPFVQAQVKQYLAEQEAAPYTLTTSKSGKYVKVPLLANKNTWTMKNIPGNGRLAENVINPHNGDVLAMRGYWPTNDDIKKWVDLGLEYLTYTNNPEDAAGDLSEEDEQEIEEMYK